MDYEKKQVETFKEHRVNLSDARYKKIERILDGKKGSVLEIGCGDGAFLEKLKREGWSVKGLEIAQSRKPYIVRGNAQEKLPFKEKFDVIIAGEVIEHMIDDERFLKNCHDSLKNNGLLILTTPNLTSAMNRVFMFFGKEPRFAYADFHYHVYTWDILKNKLERYFKIEGLKGSHIFGSTRRNVLFKPSEVLADILPTLAAHFIVVCRKA